MDWDMFVVLPCLTCNDTATSRSVTLSIFHTHLSTLTCTCMPTKVSDEQLMSNDGNMEKSFVSFKVAHPECIPTDPTTSLYLSRIADLSARWTTDDDTPRPPGITVAGRTTGRAWEYEWALDSSQTAAVRWRGGAISRSLGFGVTSTMLGQST